MLITQTSHFHVRYSREVVGAIRLACCQYQREGSFPEPTRYETQHAHRSLIEPLGIVGHANHWHFSGQAFKEIQRGCSDQEDIRAITSTRPTCGRKGILLGHDGFESVHERLTESLQAGELQVSFRFEPLHMQDEALRCAPNHLGKQGSFSHPWVTSQDERSMASRLHALE